MYFSNVLHLIEEYAFIDYSYPPSYMRTSRSC